MPNAPARSSYAIEDAPVLRISARRLSDDHAGRLGVADRDRRHRGIGDALVFLAIDPQLRVHDLIFSSMTFSTQIFLSTPVDARDGARPWGLG